MPVVNGGSGGGVVVPPGSVTVTGQLLDVVTYAPSTKATYTPSTSTLAKVDATNIVTTFTVPASGNVDVWAQIGAEFLVASTSGIAWALALLNTAGTQVGYSVTGSLPGFYLGTTYAFIGPLSALWHLTGLTAGASETLYLAAATYAENGSPTAQLSAAGITGAPAAAAPSGPYVNVPAILKVTSA